MNYGGSTAYGRAYRERLNGTWGIIDIDDCVNGAKFLAQRGATVALNDRKPLSEWSPAALEL
jgi:dipeptidyl aminopeptidase/acylaminoacyl peptidase